MSYDQKTFRTDELSPEICVVVGTRPGIVMQAPIILELRRRNLPHFVIHSGQHYSPAMDAELFEDFDLPQPDYRLEGVAEKRTHAGQTAAMMEGTEAILMQRRPRVVVVNGDANTNLAAALAARKLHMILAHTEAGIRSGDWRMPEEHNRTLMDHMSDLLLASDQPSVDALTAERVRGEIHLTGNTIVDASLLSGAKADRESDILTRLGQTPRQYAVATLHREETVDDPGQLTGAVQGLSDAAQEIGVPVVFFAHPRTLKRLEQFELLDWARALPGVQTHEAVRYRDFQAALRGAVMLFTDSGGAQQEACIHQIPCVAVKEVSEWPETVRIGANRMAGTDPARIAACAREAADSGRDWDIPFGDGTAASQITDLLAKALNETPTLSDLPVQTVSAAG